MRNFLLIILSLLFGLQSCITDSIDKPNVIVILTDDQGSVDLNCYGSTDLATPHMDGIANSGVRFTQF